MSIFSKKTNVDDQYFLSLDIGTEFVKVLVCHIVDDVVEILGFGKTRQSMTAMKGGVVTNIKSVVDCCFKSIEMAMNKLDIDTPQKVVVGIAGELANILVS